MARNGECKKKKEKKEPTPTMKGGDRGIVPLDGVGAEHRR